MNQLSRLILIAILHILILPPHTSAQEISTLPDYELALTDLWDVQWHPHDDLLALAAGHDIYLYSGDLVQQTVLQGHQALVRAISWSADGRYLASGDENHILRIWDTQLTPIQSISIVKFAGSVVEVAWSPVPGDDRIAVSYVDGSFTRMEADRHGYFGYLTYSIKLWSMAERQSQPMTHDYVSAWSLAWSPDGELLAASGSTEDTASYTVQFWETSSGKQLADIGSFADWEIYDIAWQPHSTVLAIAPEVFNSILIANLNNLDSDLRLYTTPGYDPIRVAWSPDGNFLTAGLPNGELMIWDFATQAQIKTIQAHNASITAIHWFGDGRKLATASIAEGVVRIWDMSDLDEDVTQ